MVLIKWTGVLSNRVYTFDTARKSISSIDMMVKQYRLEEVEDKSEPVTESEYSRTGIKTKKAWVHRDAAEGTT